jgi:acylglycerol lipase
VVGIVDFRLLVLDFSWRRRLGLLGLLMGFALSSCTTVPLMRRQRSQLFAESYTSADGKLLPCKSWTVPRKQSQRGIVIAIHGLSGAASDFWLLGQELPKHGYHVYAPELRGQGNDADRNMRGDILSAKDWQRDLVAFHRLVKAQHPGLPVTWYGESLGSLIAMHTAADEHGKDEPEAIVLSAPIAGLRVELGELERLLLKTTSHVAPFIRVSLGTLAGVDESKLRVTSGSSHGEQMQQTPHHVPNFTLRLLREVGSMIDSNRRAAHRLKQPVLLLASPHDIVASPEQIQSLFAEVGSRSKKLLWYSRSYHLLLHDVQREEVVRDVRRFLLSR